MEPSDEQRIPILSDFADALERAVFTGWYRRFIRMLIVAVVILGILQLLRLGTDLSVFSAGFTETLNLVTSVAVSVFVIAGALQLLIFSRGVRRREAMVAKSAEDVERSAADVTKAAEELDKAIEEPEQIEKDPDEIEDTVEQVEEQATEAKETAEKVKGDLQPPAEEEQADADDDAEDDEERR
ncbi:MAG: hypothetical protein ACI8UR_000056 [Natronomonas sp.]|jgi:hypothetical protein|uniref:hypothetical protein n=1 Tax=Natronomonas sp. TaxID=2184060 RepID=UPI0039891256